MHGFSEELAERLRSFATFLANFQGRTAEVRSAAGREANDQIVAWSLVETTMTQELKTLQNMFNDASSQSGAVGKSKTFGVLNGHVDELDRMMGRLRGDLLEAQVLQGKLSSTSRDLQGFEDSEAAAGIAELQRRAEVVQEYLSVQLGN